MAQKISELYISLGLDYSEFENDYKNAQKKVKASMSSLDRESRNAKMQMQIELSGFDNAKNQVKALGIQQSYLKTQLENQYKNVLLANSAYEQAVKKYGETNYASQRLKDALMKENVELAKVAKQARETDKAYSNTTGLAKFRRGLVSAAEAAEVPAALAAGASLKLAMEAKESESLFDISFGNMAGDARKWSQQLRSELGLNEYAVRKNAGVFYAMFDGMAIADNKAYEMSTGLTKLAYDMASFYNISNDVAFEKLRSGITGESEPLKQLGIIVDETTTKMYAYRLGIAQAGEELTQQQKVYARFAAIMDQTGKSQGDLARTIDSPMNQLRISMEKLKMRAIDVGEEILKSFGGALDITNKLLDAFDKFNEKAGLNSNKTAAFAIEALAAGGAMRVWSNVLKLPLPTYAKIAILLGILAANIDHVSTEQAAANAVIVDGNEASKQQYINMLKGANAAESNADALRALRGEAGNAADAMRLLKGDKVLSDSDLQNLRRKRDIADAQEKEKRRVAEQQAADELFQIRHEGALKTADDQLSIELANVDKREKELAKSLGKKDAGDWANQIKEETIRKHNEEIVGVYEEMFENINKLVNTSLEVDLSAVEKRKAARVKAGVDEVAATKEAEMEMASIRQQYANELIETLYKETHDTQQNRLFDLEKEKIAMLDKYGDDFRVWQTYEARKKSVIQQNQDELRQKIESDYGTELDAVKKALEKGRNVEAAYKKAHDLAVDRKRIEEEAVRYVQGKSGLSIRSYVDMPEGYQSQRAAVLGAINGKSTVSPKESWVMVDGIRKDLSNMSSAGIEGAKSYFAQWQERIDAIKSQLGSMGSLSGGMANLMAGTAAAPQKASHISISVSMPITATINDKTDVESLKAEISSSIIQPLQQALGDNEASYGG